MHSESYQLMDNLLHKYITSAEGVSVLDYGSMDINGTYRPLIPASWSYTGIDLEPGKNVDAVMVSEYDTGLPEGFCTLVISGQALEHIKNPFKAVAEMARVVSPGGYIILIAPFRIHVHRHPVDCWRFTPDGMTALCESAGLDVIETEISGDDCYCVARKPSVADSEPLTPRTPDPLSSGVVAEGSTPCVSVIIPMIRPDKGARCADAARENAGIPTEDVEILLVQDTDGIGAPAMVAKLTNMARHDLVCFLGDDTIPQPGFLKEAIAVMDTFPDHWGLVALNDGIWNGTLPTHWLAHKRLLPYLDNEFFSTAYTHCFCDNELMDRALEIGRYAYAPLARIVHDHPHVTGEAYDEGYKKAYLRTTFDADQRTYWSRKLARKGQSLAIALPLAGNLQDNEFWLSFCALEKPLHNLIAPRIPVGQFAHDIASLREDMAWQACQAGISHILFLDSDQAYPPDTVMKLLTHVSRGWDIAVAPVHRRYPPFELILKRGTPDTYVQVADDEAYGGNVIEIDAAGTGCMLISTRVLIAMARPWFEVKRTPSGEPLGEDINFCARARELGFRICADTSIQVDHIAKVSVNRTFCEIFRDLERRQRVHLVTTQTAQADKTIDTDSTIKEAHHGI